MPSKACLPRELGFRLNETCIFCVVRTVQPLLLSNLGDESPTRCCFVNAGLYLVYANYLIREPKIPPRRGGRSFL